MRHSSDTALNSRAATDGAIFVGEPATQEGASGFPRLNAYIQPRGCALASLAQFGKHTAA
jgi:hypothetical protein